MVETIALPRLRALFEGYLTPQDVARHHGVSVRVVREAVRAGELRALHPSDSPRRWLVAPADARDWRALAEQEAFSVRELGARYSVAPDTIRRAIREGALKAYRPGGRGDYRITLNDWRVWFFARPVGGLDCGIERLRKIG